MLPLAVVSGSAALAEVYYDSEYDHGPSSGYGNLDLVSVTVTNDDTNLIFAIETREIADWTKYLAFIDTGAGGADGNNNPWVRNVEMGTAGVDFFAGSWIDGGGGIDFQSFNGNNWQGAAGADLSIDFGARIVTMSFELATLGVSVGDTIGFEIATSGTTQGDPATDLMNGNSGNWGGGSSFNEMLNYTVIPAPGALSLLALAGFIARRRRA
ncbi:MAG: hypothetical protein VX641_03245 [Planctomycetota bacterium]|nr:hypothetical protein [Planctomycetota bacterium]